MGLNTIRAIFIIAKSSLGVARRRLYGSKLAILHETAPRRRTKSDSKSRFAPFRPRRGRQTCICSRVGLVFALVYSYLCHRIASPPQSPCATSFPAAAACGTRDDCPRKRGSRGHLYVLCGYTTDGVIPIKGQIIFNLICFKGNVMPLKLRRNVSTFLLFFR